MTKRLTPIIGVLLMAFLLSPAAMADWAPEDGHKMHYPQFPNTEGWDVNATNPIILADDWMCSETGWVKDIHFWGSWMHGIEGNVISFNLSIHEDIPADPPGIPYSRPGVTLWEREVTEFVVATPIDPPGPEGWFDPMSGQFFPDDHMAYFQYNVFLPEEDWFWQQEGRIYWLNISATVEDPIATQWGWKSTLDHWNDDAVWSEWFVLNWIDMYEPPMFDVSLDLAFVITGEPDTCEYYKPQYLDYAPQGMPDFDMKQLAWTDTQGNWSHDGPAALANCLWWFDSKFESSPVDPRPFGGPVNDSYPLVWSYGLYDDHDTLNVQPLIGDLATNFLGTNSAGGIGGTTPMNMQAGFRAYLGAKGLTDDFVDTLVPAPTYDYIQGEVLDCQDVILLLSFHEDQGTHTTYIGSHWVTVAGVCTDPLKRQVCISDPYLDMLEGEPPAGSVHGGTVHNDADNISGPHGQIHHDPYRMTQQLLPGWVSPVEVLNYPTTGTMLSNFAGMNFTVDWFPWGGGTVYTTVDAAFVICPDTVHIDTCGYYKPPYEDYAPFGMPDFDQKQSNWFVLPGAPPVQLWTHCGPVALANCFWWFDSKFEPSPVDPRPFGSGLNDGFPLVPSFDPTGGWDDHDTLNVLPLVDTLANYCLTNTSTHGTHWIDLANGARTWLSNVGLASQFDVTEVVLGAPEQWDFEFIREEVLRSQDVILLLGFYENAGGEFCERIGGHYVTVAGVCENPAESCLCISDPYFDHHEGEPPAGSAHGSSVHNDAAYISGPHGTMLHDYYQVVQSTCAFMQDPQFYYELAGYPVDPLSVQPFQGTNEWNDLGWIPPQGGPIHTVIEFAVVICPKDEVFDTVKCEPQGGQNPNHPPTYWYDVTPGDGTGRCDFHVKVYDSVLANYTNWVEPAGWTHLLQKIGSDWWISWCDPSCTSPITSTFRFQFDHQAPSTWADWRTTNDGMCNPYTGIVDSAENHTSEPNGLGYLVHVPNGPPPANDLVVCEPQGVQNPSHPPTYWFDVTPNGSRCDFHVRVFDSVLANYGNWVEPTGWNHWLHKVGSEWWVSWGNAGCTNPITGTFRFQFDNHNPSTWGAWTTTTAGTADPFASVMDSSGNHTGDPNGSGYQVHVPLYEEGLITKWEQPPDLDPTGMDVYATHPLILADDFLCTVTGPILEIRVYGSWLDDIYPSGDPGWAMFRLSLHDDIPVGPHGWSVPGEPLWIREFTPGEFGYELFYQGPEGWYDPSQELYIPVADNNCWVYIFRLDETEFIQHGTEEEPVVYWLDVQVYTDTPGPLFGWKTSTSHWNDDAVWSLGEDPPAEPWMEMVYPPTHIFFPQSIDLAFGIYGEEIQQLGACCVDSVCSQTTEAACLAAGGYYVGDDEPCIPDPCCCKPPTVGDVDGNPGVSLGDLTVLIDHLFVSFNPLDCWVEGNTDLSPNYEVGLGDLTVLIDHLFVSFNPLPPCPW